MNKSGNKMSIAQFYQKFGTLLILVVIFVASALISPKFLTVSNLSNVLRQIVVRLRYLFCSDLGQHQHCL